MNTEINTSKHYSFDSCHEILGTGTLYVKNLMSVGLVWLQGNIGDQMFGLTFCCYLQNQNLKRHFYPSFHLYPGKIESSIWHFFSIDTPIDDVKTIESQIAGFPIEDKQSFKEGSEFRFHHFEDNDIPLNVYHGKWQCWRYAEYCKDEVKRIFTFSHCQLSEVNQKKLETIHQSLHSVSVHIPASCTDDRKQWLFNGICTSEYYECAMKKIRDLLEGEPNFFFFREDELGVTDEERWQTMFLISECQHHIIANSSISWWGAWLGNYEHKIVLAPAKWDHVNTVSDLYPDAWLTLPVPVSKKWLNDLCCQFLVKDSLKKDLGLYDGKMGYVLFFFYCARWLDNLWFEDYAEELLDEIYTDITLETSPHFFNGLCGIGWGIEYLVQHGFVKGNTDEILADLDRKVMKEDLRRIEDTSYETGIRGILCYVSSRLSSPRSANVAIPFDPLYLNDLKEACLRLGVEMECYLELPGLLEQISSFYSNKPADRAYWHLIIKQLFV